MRWRHLPCQFPGCKTSALNGGKWCSQHKLRHVREELAAAARPPDRCPPDVPEKRWEEDWRAWLDITRTALPKDAQPIIDADLTTREVPIVDDGPLFPAQAPAPPAPPAPAPPQERVWPPPFDPRSVPVPFERIVSTVQPQPAAPAVVEAPQPARQEMLMSPKNVAEARAANAAASLPESFRDRADSIREHVAELPLDSMARKIYPDDLKVSAAKLCRDARKAHLKMIDVGLACGIHHTSLTTWADKLAEGSLTEKRPGRPPKAPPPPATSRQALTAVTAAKVASGAGLTGGTATGDFYSAVGAILRILDLNALPEGTDPSDWALTAIRSAYDKV